MGTSAAYHALPEGVAGDELECAVLTCGTAQSAAEALELVDGDNIIERAVLYAAVLALYDTWSLILAAGRTLLGIDNSDVLRLVVLDRRAAVGASLVCLAVKGVAEAEAERRLAVGIGTGVKYGDDESLSIALAAELSRLFFVNDHGVGLPRALGSGAVDVAVEEHAAVEIAEAKVTAASAVLKDEAVAGGDVDYLECILQGYDLTGLLEHGIDSHIQIALVAHINRPLRILSAPLKGVAGGAGKVHIVYGMAGLFDQLRVKVCRVEIPLRSVAVFNAVFAHMQRLNKWSHALDFYGPALSVYTGAKIKQFYDDGVAYEMGGEVKELHGFDSIILSLGVKSYNPLEEVAKSLCGEVYVVGDAESAGNANHATDTGLAAALKL